MLQAMIFLQDTPSQTILDIWQNLKCAYVSINATQLAQFLWVLFKGYPDIFEHYSRAYSRIFRTLCISGIFLSPSIFRLPRYIHNTTLNIFTKASSSTFDTVLNTPVSYRMLSNFWSNFTISQGYNVILRDILECSRFIQVYLFTPVYLDVIFQAYSVIFTTLDIFKLIWPHSGIFWMIQAFRILAQLHVFMDIEAYSELMAY